MSSNLSGMYVVFDPLKTHQVTATGSMSALPTNSELNTEAFEPVGNSCIEFFILIVRR